MYDTDDTDDNLLWLLKQAFHSSRLSVDGAISEHGVTTAQILVLRQLVGDLGLSGAELARRLLISHQGVQLALATLERNGLIERKPDPEHGRIQRAYLTEKGRRTTDVCKADAQAASEQLFSVLDPKERKALAILLIRIIAQANGDE